MTGISHKQATRLIHARLDGLLSADQARLLDEHLDSCESCRAYAAEISRLPTSLQSEFHDRWDKQSGPTGRVFEHVTTKAQSIPMTNRISSGARLVAGLAALLALGFLINFVASRLQGTTIISSGGETARGFLLAEGRLLAFASDQTGDSDIYVIHPDGTELTNLTNNPAHDSNPIWSPNGKRIAFESDRGGATQIYWMNADGSDVIQLTRDQADHFLPMNIHGNSDPWSPDGTKLLFLGQEPGASTSTLYSLDIASGTIVMLASGTVQFNNISWSPDGRYIGYVLNDSPTPDASFVSGLYVVDAAGSNRMAISALLPQTDSVYSPSYHWSRKENSIIFIAYRHLDEGKDQWIAYEAVVISQQLIERATSSTIMDAWWEGTSFIHGMDLYTLTWLRADGTFNTLEPLENCDLKMEANYGFLARRSPNGSQVINVVCPNKDMWFYYASPDGTIIKFLTEDPIVSFTPDTTVTTMSWSSDDQWIAITQVSPAKSSLYILNVNDSTTSPVEIVISDGEFYTVPSWQPVTSKNFVQEEPAPVLTPSPSPQAASGILIFASLMENGNPDIYTVRADGSGLTNITNHPAYDDHPFWSPDGTRIAFESNRGGSTQIYMMDADGSDVIQVTDGEKEHRFAYFNPWSPDGNRLIVTESEPLPSGEIASGDAKWTLLAVDVDGQNEIAIAPQPDRYMVPSWSPDASHIGYIRVVPVGDRELARLFVVDASGKNLTNVTSMLPDDEDIHTWAFTWTQGGGAVSFIADRIAGGEYNGRSAAYEASLDGATLVERGTSSTPMLDWYDATAFTVGVGGASPFTWLRSDGTSTTLDPLENCETSRETQINYMYSRSPRGDLLIGVNCTNSDLWLYRANGEGTAITPLLNSPITVEGSVIVHIAWSPDGRFAALNLASTDKRLMGIYVVDVEAALRDPSTRPFPIMTGKDSTMYYWYPAWQPTP
jgi:Tol biopolymer transport system component